MVAGRSRGLKTNIINIRPTGSRVGKKCNSESLQTRVIKNRGGRERGGGREGERGRVKRARAS